MDFKRTFNSTTMYGRRNVAAATLGSIATFILYKKMTGGKVRIQQFYRKLDNPSINHIHYSNALSMVFI